MTIASDPIDRQNTIIQTSVKITKEIFHWQGRVIEQSPTVPTNAHCLLRTYAFPETSDKPRHKVIIASELFSNEYKRRQKAEGVMCRGRKGHSFVRMQFNRLEEVLNPSQTHFSLKGEVLNRRTKDEVGNLLHITP